MSYEAVSAWASVAAAVGQVLGAIAVVVSLAYLARQVKENTRAAHTASYQAMVTNSLQIMSAVCTHPEFAALVDRFFREPASVTEPADLFRCHTFMLLSFRHFENTYYQYRVGTLEAVQWKTYEGALDHWLQFPGGGGTGSLRTSRRLPRTCSASCGPRPIVQRRGGRSTSPGPRSSQSNSPRDKFQEHLRPLATNPFAPAKGLRGKRTNLHEKYDHPITQRGCVLVHVHSARIAHAGCSSGGESAT